MQKTRRRMLFLSVTAVVVGLAVGVWALWPASKTAITRANATMLHKGLTKRQVETILGGTPRDECQESYEIVWPEALGWEHGIPAAHMERWVSAECAIDVWFDDDHAIAVYVGGVRMRDTLFERLRRWLGI